MGIGKHYEFDAGWLRGLEYPCLRFLDRDHLLAS